MMRCLNLSHVACLVTQAAVHLRLISARLDEGRNLQETALVIAFSSQTRAFQM